MAEVDQDAPRPEFFCLQLRIWAHSTVAISTGKHNLGMGDDMSDMTAAAARAKIFVSYSRADIDFADQLVLALDDRGFAPLLDRHDIDAAEKWQERLRSLILASDTVVFVLSATSAASPVCAWEVEEALRLGKRLIPVVPHDVRGVTPPTALTELNYIHFYTTNTIPGSGFYDGLLKLERALRIDLDWLRRQTRLTEQAAEWRRARADDLLLRGVALEDALTWRATPPAGVLPAEDARAFIDASEAAEIRRKAEVASQIAARESALAEKETALVQKAAADRLARRATMVGALVAMVLIMLAGIGGWSAMVAARDAEANRALVFAGEADERARNGLTEEAILMAVVADPAAQRNMFARFLLPGGHEAARTALVSAITHNAVERVFGQRGRGVEAAAFSSDGRLVATGVRGEGAQIWEAATGRLLHHVQAAGVNGVYSLLPGGAQIAVANREGYSSTEAVEIRDVASADLVATLEGESPEVYALAASHDGRLVAAGARDGSVRVWDIVSRRLLYTLQVGEGSRGLNRVRQLAFSTDGRHAAAAARQHIQIWDVVSGRVVRTIEFARPALAFAFSPDGRNLVSGLGDGDLRVWNVSTGELLKAIAHPAAQIVSISYAPDGAHIAVASFQGDIIVYTSEGRVVRRWTGPQASSVEFSPDCQFVLVGLERGQARMLRMAGPAPLLEIEGEPVETSAANRSGEVFIVRSGNLLRTIRGVDGVVLGEVDMQTRGSMSSRVDVSADGRSILASEFEGLPTLYGANGALVRTFGNSRAAAALSDNGRRVLTTVPEGLVVWDVDSGAAIKRIPAHPAGRLVISPDGGRGITQSGERTILWDLEAGEELARFEVVTVDVIWPEFSADSERLALFTTNEGAKIIDARNGQLLRTINTGAPTAAQFSPDGHMLATSTLATTVWDIATGRALQTINAVASVGGSVTFADQGRQLRLLSASGHITHWALDSILLASARTQARVGCETLARIGVWGITDADRDRFPILRGEHENPCAR